MSMKANRTIPQMSVVALIECPCCLSCLPGALCASPCPSTHTKEAV